ncbi:MAG: LPS export ABC transporter periplasmic protein LptC [Cyanobacteria bacterium SIG30]|nr:LPS export ABC transporter periplasmic protein LptC [Cyanobacteria bacterium SIG30]
MWYNKKVMNSKKVYTIIFTLVALLILFGFVWSWFVTKDLANNFDDATKNEQKVAVSNLILTESKDEKKYWELYAKKGFYEGGKESVVLKDILGNFYDDDENVILSLQAENGTYTEGDKTILLSGNVLVVAKDGSSILADNIVWKGKDEDIIASGNVRINRNNELITESSKAVFNVDLTYFKIEGKSKSKVYDLGEYK